MATMLITLVRNSLSWCELNSYQPFLSYLLESSSGLVLLIIVDSCLRFSASNFFIFCLNAVVPKALIFGFGNESAVTIFRFSILADNILFHTLIAECFLSAKGLS